MQYDTRKSSRRFAVSLVVAFLTFLGLAIGGSLSPSPRSQNGMSSSGKEGQPAQVTVRDTLRAVVTAERKMAAKAFFVDGSADAPLLADYGFEPVSGPAGLETTLRQIAPLASCSYCQARAPPAPPI